MHEFLIELKYRNETLFYFGLACFVFSMGCLVMTKISVIQVYQVSAWYKPLKFAFSTFTFVWAMAWYCHYLPSFNMKYFNGAVIVLLSFEILYIAFMAGQGKISHYNVSTPFYEMMFSLMALAATLVTLYTAYVGLLFCTHDVPLLSSHYLWAIRLGIFIFVVFSFEGFLMGSRMSHSVGVINDNSNLFILGFSKIAGDLRVSHFIGMHALQVLPFISFYVLKNTKATVVLSILYLLLSLLTLHQALNGKPLRGNTPKHQIKS